jgi:hypothetical protein
LNLRGFLFYWRSSGNTASQVIATPARKPKPYPHLLEPELPDFLRALKQSTSGLIAYVAR